MKIKFGNLLIVLFLMGLSQFSYAEGSSDCAVIRDHNLVGFADMSNPKLIDCKKQSLTSPTELYIFTLIIKTGTAFKKVEYHVLGGAIIGVSSLELPQLIKPGSKE